MAARPRGGVGRVWALNVGMTAAAAGVYFGAVRNLGDLPGPARVPWWALAVLFYAAETLVVHLHLRRNAHSLSLSEAVLIPAMFCASPTDVLLAQLLGSTVSLRFHRRQPLVKLVFNLAVFGLGACLTLLVIHGLQGPLGLVGPAGLLACLIATSAATAVTVLALMLALTFTDKVPDPQAMLRSLAFGVMGTAANTCLGFVSVDVMRVDPHDVWLLIVPAGILYVCYRAYTAMRRKSNGIEFLFDAAQAIQAGTFESSLVEVLGQARRMFRAEVAEIVLLPVENEKARRTRVGPGDIVEVMVPVDSDDTRRDLVLPIHGRPLIVRREDPPGPLTDHLRERGMSDAMLAPLAGERRLLGVMMVGGHLGDVDAFHSDDLTLLQTLATHTTVALENGRLERSLAQLSELEERLTYQAYHDSLTGLANRALFVERVEQALQPMPDAGRAVTAMFLDLDDFKLVNDSLGHNAGDEILVLVALRVRACLRDGDLPARLGGDELAVLLTPGSGPEEAQSVASRILARLAEPFMVDGRRITIGGSLGIASARPGECRAGELLRNADVAMYTAKNQGKNRHCVFEPHMHETVIRRHDLKADLLRALERDELRAFFQPIVDLRTGKVAMVEALIRWDHPVRGLVAPEEFIGVAEESGLILAIGSWMLKEACTQARAWQVAHPDEPPLIVAVNCSGRQLEQADFVQRLREGLEASDLAPQHLVIEITESSMLRDPGAVRVTLEAVRALGVRVGIDDFGTGYSSLGALRSLPVDILKLAKPFVDDLTEGSGEEGFVRAIVALAGSLGMVTVAEGIEKRHQAERLRIMGCELGQGFLFAEAAPAEIALEAVATRFSGVGQVLRLA